MKELTCGEVITISWQFNVGRDRNYYRKLGVLLHRGMFDYSVFINGKIVLFHPKFVHPIKLDDIYL